MLWYSRLYVGERARKHLFSIIRSIREKKYRPGVFVITPASNGNNILDIYPAPELLLPYYRERDFLIMGIALGYDEAAQVAARIVEDLYQKTGGFDLKELLEDQAE